MNRIIIFLYSLVFFLTPLVFFTGSSEIFEFNKMVFVYASTVLIAASWCIKMIKHKKIVFTRTPADIPILLFLLSQVISTFLSIDTYTSIFGYYSRFNGGLLSSLSYTLLYWGFVSNIDTKHTLRLINVILVSATITAVWGILEHFGLSVSCVLIKGTFDTNCWVQDIQNRVFATFGQPNWMAAFLAAVLPLAGIIKLSKSKFIVNINKYKLTLVISAILFSALLFTKSRSGFLGFIAANAIYWLFLFKSNFKKNIRFAILVNLIFVILFLTIESPWRDSLVGKITPSQNTQTIANIIPLDETGGTESGDIRKIVWTGAIGIWEKYPVFGTGPETFAYSYYFTRPLAHNNTSEWNYVYNKAHNEYLNFLATTGGVGLAVYLIMICAFIFQIYNSKPEIRYSLLAGFIALLVTNFFGFSVVPTQVLLFLFPAMAVSLKKVADKRARDTLSGAQKFVIVGISLITVFTLVSIGRYWWADYLYAKARDENKSGQMSEALKNINKATTISPREPVYLSTLADIYVSIATVASNGAEEKVAEYLKSADQVTDITLKFSPYNVKLIRAAANRYSDMAEINEVYVYSEEKWVDYASKIAPTDAGIWYQYALVKAKLGEPDHALELAEKTISMRPMYKNARRLAAFLYEERGDIQSAVDNLEYILKYISPGDQAVISKLEELYPNLPEYSK